MVQKRKPYKTYTKEFKIEAVRLMTESDRPSSESAMKLGVRRNQLYKWKEQLEKEGVADVARKRGRPKKEDESEVSRLRRELERVKEENEILKKAAVFFAKELD